jgi:hypothetical protein
MCAVIRLPLAAATSLWIFSREDEYDRGNEHPPFPTIIFMLQIIVNFLYWLPLVFLVFALYHRLYQLTEKIEDVATRLLGCMKIAALIIVWPIMDARADLFPSEKTQLTVLVFYESLQGITMVAMQFVCFYCLYRIAHRIDHIVPSGVSSVPLILWLTVCLIGVFDVGLLVIYAEKSPVGNLIATCVGAWNSAVILKILLLAKVKHRQYSNDALNGSSCGLGKGVSGILAAEEGIKKGKSTGEKLDYANISQGHLYIQATSEGTPEKEKPPAPV